MLCFVLINVDDSGQAPWDCVVLSYVLVEEDEVTAGCCYTETGEKKPDLVGVEKGSVVLVEWR